MNIIQGKRFILPCVSHCHCTFPETSKIGTSSYRLFCLRIRTSVLDAIGDSPFYVLYGREPRLPIKVKYLPPESDDLSTILDYRKRVVEKVELAQNLARENLQRAQQKMKDYYDQKTKEPVFEVGQRVWVYTPRTRKGLSKKLMHNWLGPYRIVEKLSPVHFKLRTITNKKLLFRVTQSYEAIC